MQGSLDFVDFVVVIAVPLVALMRRMAFPVLTFRGHFSAQPESITSAEIAVERPNVRCIRLHKVKSYIVRFMLYAQLLPSSDTSSS